MSHSLWGRVALSAFVISISAVADASVDASVTGVVEDALLHPLENATVIIHDASGHTIAKTTTDKTGRFMITGVPLGDYTVEASQLGLVSDHTHVQLTSGQVAEVELVLVNSEEIVEIKEDWAVPEPSKATGSVTTVGRQALSELPGGDDRPITDVVATQPGVVQDALGEIYVRGTHGDVQYQIDGIPVPDSVGSLFAASIPVRLIQSLEMQTGGMPAEFGYRLGAVINLVTRAAVDHPEGNVSVRYGSFNTVEPGAVYATKLGDKAGMFVGGSFRYSERALDPPSIDPILHDTGTTGRVFARLDYQPCECNRYELFAMYAHNRYEVPLDPYATPNAPPDKYGNEPAQFIPLDTDATETEHEAFAAMSFTHKLDKGFFMVAPLYKLSTGKLLGDPEHALGPTAAPDAVTSDVTRIAHHAGAVSSIAWNTGKHLLKAGVQTDFLHGITRFTQYTMSDSASGSDHTNALLSGVYAQDHVALDDFSLDYGVRFDQMHVMLENGETDDSFGASPRLGASYAFSKDYVAHAFAGVKWMPPSPLDAAGAARALGLVPPDVNITYDLLPETDLYSEAGINARPMHLLSTELTVWGRYAYNQLDSTSIGSTSLDANYNFKRGRAGGIEASTELRVGPWLSAFLNGSLGFAQGRGIASAKFLFDADALADNRWQTLDHAQLFTGNAGATIRDGRFTLTGLLAYASGLRTGPANDQHVPQHLRADVSMSYTFVAREYPLRVGFDVINLADAHYAYRIGNGFVGSSYGAPRSVYLSLSIPLASEPHHGG